MSTENGGAVERRFETDKTRIGFKIELRAEGKGHVLKGHASVFNQRSLNLGGFFEVVAPGTFKDTINQDDIHALFNHDPNFVLARNTSSTLKLFEDTVGLGFEAQLSDSQTVRDMVVTPIERGDIDQMSFGFRVKPGGQDWAEDPADNAIVRTLKAVRLFDVSPVTRGAYPSTDVAVRSLEEWKKSREPKFRALFMDALIRQQDAERD